MDGRRLKQLLREYGWSQAEFAKRAGISQATISLICTGERRPSLDLLDRMCRALGISHDELLGAEAHENADVNAMLTPDENTLISKYRTLSPRDKRAVQSLIDSLSYPEKACAHNAAGGE